MHVVQEAERHSRKNIMDSLKKKVIKGSLWASSGSFAVQAVNFIIKIFLARILLPEDFGIFAMALIMITLLNLLSGFGIGGALIYRKKSIDKALNVAFFISPVIGIILYFVTFIFSGFVADFFNVPVLSPIIRLVGISFILDSFVVVPHAFLTKNLLFRQRSLAEFFPILFYGVTAVILAYNGFGVWSLVISHIVQHVSWVALLWLFCPWRPKFVFDRKIAAEMLHFGKYVFTSSFLAFLINYSDNAVVGKMLGDKQLGFYSFAFNIAALPITALIQFVSGVFHPAYSRLQNDALKLRQAYLMSLKWVLLITMPVSGGLLVLADTLIISFFGAKWAPMVTVLKILSMYPFMKSISVLSSYLLEGVGHPKISTKIMLIQYAIMIPLIFPAIIYYGIEGVACVIMISLLFSMLAFMRSIAKVVAFSYAEYAKVLWKTLVSTIFMVLIVYLLKTQLFYGQNILNLVVLVASGVLSYIMMSIIIDRELVGELKDISRQAF